MALKYIYGIIQTHEEIDLGVAGLGGSPVHTVAHQGLGCVLSDYLGPEFSALDKGVLVRRLLAHQAVVEWVMGQHTILPVKFGTMLGGVAEVAGFLWQGHQRFTDALARVQDKVEVEVAATWDTGQILQEVGREADIQRAREETIATGAVEVKQRVRLGQMVKEALERRRAGHQERMIDFLRPLAVDVQPNALVSDQMVMNVAFLLDRAKQGEFDSRVKQLDALFLGEFNFRIIGPLPAYSFSTVEVARPNWERLFKARGVLGLPEVILEPEVRMAYRELAARSHPDLNPGDSLARERLARIQEAQVMLLAYCRGVGEAAQQETGLPLTREAVERAFLITLRRSADKEIPQFQYGGAHI